MKVLQINASYKPAYIYGGPTISVSKLCEGLVKQGVDVEVLTTTANGDAELPVKPGETQVVDGVKVRYFKRLTKDHTHFSPALLWYFFNFNRRKSSKSTSQPVVHIHAWWNLVSVLSCLIAKLKGIPVVLSPRGTLSLYSFGNRNSGVKNFIHRYLGKRLLEYCRFHVTSEIEKQGILKLVKPKSITVIPNFINLPEQTLVSHNEYQSGKAFNLLFLSRIEEKKGLDILIKALSLVIEKVDSGNRNGKIALTIAGTGDKGYVEKLKILARDSGIESNVNWVGQQNQEEKWSVLASHHLLVLPSYNENFANVVLEALAMGTAVVLSNQVGLVDYVSNNKYGLCCSTTPESVAEKIMEAISDTDLLQTVRREAPVKVREDFKEELIVKMFQNLYETIKYE